MKRITFVPYKHHLVRVYAALARSCSIQVVPHTTITPRQMPHEVEVKLVRYRWFGLRLLRLVGVSVNTPAAAPGLAQLLTQQQTELVITCDIYHWYSLQALWYVRRHPGVRLFVLVETKRWPPGRVSRSLLKLFFWYWRQQADHLAAVLVYTPEGEALVTNALPGVPVRQVSVPVVVPPQLPAKDWLPQGVLRILMNARYVPFKRHTDVLAALVLLREQGIACSLTCIASSDVGQAELAAQAAALGLQSQVTYLPPQPHAAMTAVYRQCDVLVLPSDNEAIGMVVPEAMAAGLPTITSDTVGANVYVVPNVTGLIVPTKAVSELAQALRSLYQVGVAERMGQAAHEHIKHNYNEAACAQQWQRSLAP